MMNQPKTKHVDPTDIPEVVDFLDSDAKVQEFKEQYADVFEVFSKLIEERNQKLQAAEKVVRAHGVSCGPFDLYQYQTKIDAQGLFDALGREDFLKVGGAVKTVPEYSIDKKQFEAAVAQKKVPAKVVEAVVNIAPRYKCPDSIKL